MMLVYKRIFIRKNERGFKFYRGDFVEVLDPGLHTFVDFPNHIRVDVVSTRDPWIHHNDLKMIVDSGTLGDRARVLDLKDHERGLVWVDGRFEAVVGPGMHALWTINHDVRVEIIDTAEPRFTHPQLAMITRHSTAPAFMTSTEVPEGFVGLFMRGGKVQEVIKPSLFAYWRVDSTMRLLQIDMREQKIDVTGQEIMTADRVTLRVNALVTFEVADPVKAHLRTENHNQSLYREVQLALRAVIGGLSLDELLAEKNGAVDMLSDIVRPKADALGLTLLGLGIRDVILPGEMRDILNRVTEAKKAAEADLIKRREETAGMRSQANTAKIMESNPMLMRMRELEVLEKISEKTNLTVILGENGLAERVTKLL